MLERVAQAAPVGARSPRARRRRRAPTAARDASADASAAMPWPLTADTVSVDRVDRPRARPPADRPCSQPRAGSAWRWPPAPGDRRHRAAAIDRGPPARGRRRPRRWSRAGCLRARRRSAAPRTPAVSTSRRWASPMRTCSLTRSRVVPATAVTIARSPPTSALNTLDLPTFGAPATTTRCPSCSRRACAPAGNERRQLVAQVAAPLMTRARSR